MFNGQRYLCRAVNSILQQTFSDFDLLICDNASVDATEEIARNYARADERIRYYRHTKNVGPNLNFSHGVDMVTGEYFKWAAHDDELAPDFLQTCITPLDNNPQAVLCQSLVSIIDERGAQLAVYDSALRHADSPRQPARFASLVLRPHVCTDLFGVIRRNALTKTKRLKGNYHGCDRALLAELSLIGPFEKVNKPLFKSREHKQRYVRSVLPSQRTTFHITAETHKTELSRLLLHSDYRRAVGKHGRGVAQRLRCYWHLACWWFVAWNSLRVGVELVSRIYPPFYDYAKKLSDILLKPKHATIFSIKTRKNNSNEVTRRDSNIGNER